jgi:spermidine synthase
VLWTRLLGFAFGTTTEAIGTVLAIFFGGMALGNWLAARRIDRVVRPLRLYGLLELGIGFFALLSLPLLTRLDVLYAFVGADHPTWVMATIRAIAAAAILLPPTIAMGATLPVVARGLVARDASLGRWSAYLYSANTFGAVTGAYLCGFWMIPELGLSRTVVVAALVNLAVAAAVWHWAGGIRVSGGALVAAGEGEPASGPALTSVSAPAGGRGFFLLFFGISGFVAIGYEIVWSKVFTIVMEGTLYGFSTVLSAYLLGLALGSLLVARFVDGIRDLPRAFAALHVGIALSVALGLMFVADLPHWHRRVAELWVLGGGVHGLYLLAAPIILLPTILFGAAFPVLIRLYTTRASEVGEGMGIATAVNTCGSIAASLLIGFWAIPSVGIDATLYALVLIELFVALLILLRFQTSQGFRRIAASAATGLLLVTVSFSYNGVHIQKAVAGRWIDAADLRGYRSQLDEKLASSRLVIEGKTSVVSVDAQPGGFKLMTNGMPEAGYTYAPPHRALATLMLGMLPYLTAEAPKRALVVGFGGGATLDALRKTELEEIEVVELERGVVDAAALLYQGRPDPLLDPRVELFFNDGRNHLLLGRHRERRGYDVIASQPSHPWLAGAANLFTEEYFQLALDNLTPGGAFALWVNGFHAETESLLALFNSFHRVFPSGVVVSGGGNNQRSSFILVGTREPHGWRLDRLRERLAEPGVRDAFAVHDIENSEQLLASFEAPIAEFAAIAPDARNTDDNAFVEMHLSRSLGWVNMEYSELEARLSPDAPVLPEFSDAIDVQGVARAMLDTEKRSKTAGYGPKLSRLIAVQGDGLDPYMRATLAAEITLRRADAAPAERAAAAARLREQMADQPDRPEAARALARALAEQSRRFADAAAVFEEAWRRSGEAQDAYDAARAWHWVDRSAAFRWMDRIPASARGDFPRLALFEAERFLASPSAHAGNEAARLHEHWDRVNAYLQTDEGRRLPGVHRVLSELAERRDDERMALAHRDADARQRREAAGAELLRAGTALAAGQLPAARSALSAADRLLPSDPTVLAFEARLAAAEADGPALSEALWNVRSWSPTLRQGVGNENALRAELALPLLPEVAPSQLEQSDSLVVLPR